MIGTIATREWLSAFRTPLAWLLLAAAQILLTWIMLRVLDGFTGLEPPERSAGLNLELSHHLFGSAAVFLMLTVPLLAARSISGEIRDGIWPILVTAPATLAEILIGKFCALATLVLLLCLIPLALSLTLLDATPIDPGLFLAATLGLWLTGLLFCSVGLFAASLTTQPALAAVIAFALLTLISLANRADHLAAEQITILDWLSWNQHLFWFLSGVVRVSDLTYFLLATALFMTLAHRRLGNLHLG
ncbi:MAG: ABC transporter permease subunit [Thiohalocapsa sp.]